MENRIDGSIMMIACMQWRVGEELTLPLSPIIHSTCIDRSRTEFVRVLLLLWSSDTISRYREFVVGIVRSDERDGARVDERSRRCDETGLTCMGVISDGEHAGDVCLSIRTSDDIVPESDIFGPLSE